MLAFEKKRATYRALRLPPGTFAEDVLTLTLPLLPNKLNCNRFNKPSVEFFDRVGLPLIKLFDILVHLAASSLLVFN